MKKKKNKMATISMLQMVADYAKKDYISCSANKLPCPLAIWVFALDDNLVKYTLGHGPGPEI